VALIVTLAEKVKLRLIAEGLETARQVERMRELGCEWGQGYYFSQPMDAKGAQVFLREQVWSKASGAGR